MTLWLKSTKMYSVAQINSLPTIVSCSVCLSTDPMGVEANQRQEIVFVVVSSWISDYFQKPSLTIFVFGLLQLFGYAVFVDFPNNHSFLFATYIIAGSGYGTIGPLLNAWASSSCGGDKHLRAMTTGFITTMG